MEKTHHAAKAANQNHTQHFGTKSKTSAIVQQYEHSYRNIQHRFVRNERLAWERAKPVDQNAVDTVERRRVASNSPGVIEGRDQWRAERVREGSRYVLRKDPITVDLISSYTRESLEIDTQESPEPIAPQYPEPDTTQSMTQSTVGLYSQDESCPSIWELPVEDITSQRHETKLQHYFIIVISGKFYCIIKNKLFILSILYFYRPLL